MGEVGSKILSSRPEFLVNFDFTNFISKTGIINFFPFSTFNESTQEYFLSSNEEESIPETTATATNSGVFVTFETEEFTVPAEIQGNAILNFTWRFNRNGQAGTGSGRLIAHIGITRNSVTESIGNATTPDLTADNGNTTTGRVNLNITIPRTTIKKGEKLAVYLVLSTSESFTGNTTILHDPKDATTFFRASIPFKINN